MLSPDPDTVLDRLRALCLSLPDAAEKISHGTSAFHGAGGIFAWWRHDHHGDGRTVVCVKTTGREEQEMLLEADPDLYSRPAYLWPSGWVAMDLAAPDTDWDHIEARLRTSYDLAAPRRKRRTPNG
jgi:hypothetical protein